jgi:hypothetical protein
MTTQQFIDNCKLQGVNVLSVYFKKKAIHVTYTVTLSERTVSQRHHFTATYISTATADSLQLMYNDKFAQAGTWVRF